MNRRILIIFALLAVAGAYINLVKPQPVLLDTPLSQFPLVVGEWRMVKKDTFSQNILDVLRPTDYLSRDYANAAGEKVTLYIGYHGGRKGDGGIHSPRNCLPGAGWFLDSTGIIPANTGDSGSIDIVNTVMSKGSTTLSFYYWFQVKGRVINDEYSLKLAEVWNALVSQRKDAAFIRISMPIPKGSSGRVETLDNFVTAFYSTIHASLPQ